MHEAETTQGMHAAGEAGGAGVRPGKHCRPEGPPRELPAPPSAAQQRQATVKTGFCRVENEQYRFEHERSCE